MRNISGKPVAVGRKISSGGDNPDEDTVGHEQEPKEVGNNMMREAEVNLKKKSGERKELYAARWADYRDRSGGGAEYRAVS